MTGYYRLIGKLDDHQPGEIFYVVQTDEYYYVLVDGSRYRYDANKPEDLAQFYANFEHEPDGDAIRQAEIAELMAQLSNIGEIAQTQKQLADLRVDASTIGTSIQPVTAASDAKRNISLIRNDIQKKSKELKRKTERLESLLSERTRAMEIQAAEWGSLLAKVEEAIWTISLYLGKAEELHVLRTGEPAPAEEPVTLRQMVMYMDEECGQEAGMGGIDINKLHLFDQWVMADPANLNRVLYENKGVVALHPRRRAYDYNSVWADAQNRANLTWTYFLIRNGENVYRVLVDINVGDHLFPRTDEFEGIFHGLKPGSDQYMKAVDEANDRNRHYLRVLLILQGLMDRTPIFQPMPMDRLNLCDPATVSEYVRFVYDTEKVLTDGKPTFSQWQSEINSRLEVGCRVVGSWSYNLRGGEYKEPRIYPANSCTPCRDDIYTIEKREGDGFVFLYERKEDRVYDRYGRYKTPTVRARCIVYEHDDFLLNFDGCTVEELRYYQTHRASRTEYASMLPVLEAAIAAKEREERDEEPFRLLLSGRLISRYGMDRGEADDAVTALVEWWKFKNRAHRALLSDDSLALDQIVAEQGTRMKQGRKRDRMDHHAAKVVILNQDVRPVYVAHKSDNRYVAYVPSNAGNIWVTEQEWAVVKGEVTLRESKEWRLVDNRHKKWHFLFSDPRWADWRINPVRSTVLTDPEIAALVDTMCERIEARDSSDRWVKTEIFLPLYVTCDEDFELCIWYCDSPPHVPNLLVTGGEIKEPGLRRLKFKWDRKQEGVVLQKALGMAGTYISTRASEQKDTVRSWDENRAKFDAWIDEAKLAQRTSRSLSSKYSYAAQACEAEVLKAETDKARLEFALDHGDPELWEDHLKGLKLQRKHFEVLRSALAMFAERDLDPVGLTTKQVFDRAREWGLFERKLDWGNRYTDVKIPDELPDGFVIPPVPTEEDED